MKEDSEEKVAENLTSLQLFPADYANRNPSATKQRIFLVAYYSYLFGIANSNTKIIYKTVIDHFIRFLNNIRGVTPLDTIGVDISAWRTDLQLTGGVAGATKGSINIKRCSPQAKASIEQKTSILSGFFQYLQKPGMDGSKPLISYNPVEALHSRFTIEKYSSSRKIDKDSFNKILAEINIKTIKGLRDYALLFGYYMTGRRNSEWVNLRWGDINFNSNSPTYTFIRKGQKITIDEMPEQVFKVLHVYLKARWGEDYAAKMLPTTYLFTAMPGRGGIRQQQDNNHPLTERFILDLVKTLAKKAGLDEDKITVHSLRHLHAETLLELGASVEEIRARLKHESLATTQRYVSSMTNDRNRLAQELSEKVLNLPDTANYDEEQEDTVSYEEEQEADLENDWI